MTTSATLEVLILANSAGFQKGLLGVGKSLSAWGANISRTAAVAGVAIASLSIPIVLLAKNAVMAAARVDELVTINEVLAKNAGLSTDAVKKAAEAVRLEGIEMAVSQRVVAEFARSHLDLSKASKLARVAQDAATIAGINSTEALDGIIRGIITLQPELIRTNGITIDLAQAQKAYAKSLGVSVEDLTSAQKQQIALNAVLEAGVTVAGAYEASMTKGSKIIRSYPRYINDILVNMGTPFLGVFDRAAKGIANFLKKIGEMTAAGGGLRPMLDSLAASIGKFMDKLSSPKILLFIHGLANKMWKFGTIIVKFIENLANGKYNKQIAAVWAQIGTTIKTFASIWKTILLPAIKAFWNWLVTVFIPALGRLKEWLDKTGIPAFTQWFERLSPAMQNVGYGIALIVATGGLPTLISLLSLLGNVIMNVVWPALTGLAAALGIPLLPLLVIIATLYLVYLAFKTNFGGITTTIVKLNYIMKYYLGQMLNSIKINLAAIGKFLVSPFLMWGKTFMSVVNAVKLAWNNFLAFIRKPIVWPTLPGWLTPGSPTPFEIGLRGISSAMDTLSKKSLPEMNMGFNGMTPAMAGVGGGNTNVTNNVRFQQATPAVDRRAVEDVLRKTTGLKR